jgi:hypothetical protein
MRGHCETANSAAQDHCIVCLPLRAPKSILLTHPHSAVEPWPTMAPMATSLRLSSRPVSTSSTCSCWKPAPAASAYTTPAAQSTSNDGTAASLTTCRQTTVARSRVTATAWTAPRGASLASELRTHSSVELLPAWQRRLPASTLSPGSLRGASGVDTLPPASSRRNSYVSSAPLQFAVSAAVAQRLRGGAG